MPPRVLVSACLLGQPVRYDGDAKPCHDPILARWRERGLLIPVCPELLGGLSVPRQPAEILGPGAGHGVLDGHARLVTAHGQDLTEAFLLGAQRALERALAQGARLAVLKARSPSCGRAQVYDGTHAGALIDGMGVTAALLERHGVRVFDEHELERADAYLLAMTSELP